MNSLITFIDEHFSEVDFNSGLDLMIANKYYDLLSDENKARITNYEALKAAQETFDNLSPIQLNSCTLGKNIIGDPTIKISATNMTDSTIKEYSICIFAYDSDGVPVKVDSPIMGDGFSAAVAYTNALKPGATSKSNSYWQLDGDYNEMQQIVAILKSTEFFDGTIWLNTQYSTLYDKYNGKILSADDENILPKA